MAVEDEAVERLTNLTFALLGAERPKTYEWVRNRVTGYHDKTEEAFSRMLLRDIASMRRAGVPARMENGLVWVDKDSYELAPVEFTDAEATVLGLAGDLGQQGSLGAFARSGWTKIAASGATRSFNDAPLSAVDNDILRLSAETVQSVAACVRNNTRMSFDYRPTPTAEKQRRVMDPWGIVALNNLAYIVGWDVDRQAERSFRALRVSDIKKVRSTNFTPATRPLQDVVEASIRGPLVDARLRVVDKHAHDLVEQGRFDGDELVMQGVERDWLVRTAVSFAPYVAVLEPAEVRDEVLGLLKEATSDEG